MGSRNSSAWIHRQLECLSIGSSGINQLEIALNIKTIKGKENVPFTTPVEETKAKR